MAEHSHSPESARSDARPTTTPAEQAEHRQALIASLVFPVFVIIGGIVGYASPATVAPLGPWVTVMLGVVMFTMGLTLTPRDFLIVARQPLPVLIGVLAQFVIMPLIAVILVTLLNLPAEIAVGVILLGCCPGGTASNVVSFLARGDVALSVAMTAVSTLLAPLVTPVLTLWLAGQYMELSGSAMALSIVKVVLVPVLGGLVLRSLLPRLVERLIPALPWISVAAISVIVAVVVAGSRNNILTAGIAVFIAAILHNLLGYALGYATGRVTGQSVPARRTVAIEVGLQNSGLATALAMAHINPLAALPGAVASVWQNLSGAVLAASCRLADQRAERAQG